MFTDLSHLATIDPTDLPLLHEVSTPLNAVTEIPYNWKSEAPGYRLTYPFD